MAYVITNQCVGTCDTGCVDVCPCDCIIGPVPLDELRAVPASQRAAAFPGIQMFIDPDPCIDCGACVAECPAQAIYHEDDVPTEHRESIARNAQFFRDRPSRS
jgi:NAD-dependent dihydropyrimidine dehydrogenase PreA subunit